MSAAAEPPSVAEPPASPASSVREHPMWRYAGILLASLFGHAVCFYLFQVAYAPVTARTPVPARLYLPMPGSEEAKLVAAWAEMADPALPALPGPTRDEPPGTYRPSFAR